MKKNNVNEQRRDFLKKTSLGVAGSALSGGMVGVVSKSAVAKEAENENRGYGGSLGTARCGCGRWQGCEIRSSY